jgi:histidine triad (HIT) family protein
MTMTDGCLFCDIVASPDLLVLEADDVAAFLDHRPVFPGHVLVVPRAHIETLDAVPVGLLAPLFEAVQVVMRAIESELDAEGTFVAANNRVSQSVPHLHVHVVPRRRKDGLRGFFWPRHPYGSDEEMAAMRDQLRKAVADLTR